MLDVIVWKLKMIDFTIVGSKFVVKIFQRHVEELLSLTIVDARSSEGFSLQTLLATLIMQKIKALLVLRWGNQQIIYE